jgi:haloacetate dehalogenase
MPKHVTAAMATVNGLRVHYVTAGEGPPVVLLHGWPQTCYMWRLAMPTLAEYFTLVAPDLRGYGLTDKPADGYDKRTMASDVRALVRHLGFDRISLVGHDRGARVAHRYALDHPDEVTGLAFLDIIPTREMFRMTDATTARGYWHWFFHLQPDLPELLVGQNVGTYLRYFFERWTFNRPPVEEAVPEYIRAFSRPGALRAGFADYRATFPTDIEADDETAESGQRLEMPVLVLWGASGLTGSLPVLEIWKKYATDVRGEAILECGHFLPEEQPGAVADQLVEFLTGV